MSKSQSDFQSRGRVIGSRLVISPLDGSSRIARLQRIYSSRSVNQPFFRNHRLVRVGAGAIWKKDLNRKSRFSRYVEGIYQIATLSMKTPSMRKSHRQPSRPATPRILSTPKAIKGATISTRRRVIQNKHNLNGSSSVLKKYDCPSVWSTKAG
jgi:hypothetical protein